jgi:cobalt-zinc-cadmium efflux system membrane fusion protein
MTMTTRSWIMLGTLTLSAACSANSANKAGKRDTAKKDTSMAPMADMPDMPNMPGMSKAPADTGRLMTAKSLDLSANQIAHGKIAWGAAGPGATSATASIPGQLVPDEDKTARLGAPARGRILAVRVSPGDRVAVGDALAVMQSAEASVAQSDIAKAVAAVASHRAQARYAKAARDRAERLLAIKAIPRQEYEKAIADDELAQAELRQTEAELGRARTVAQQIGADTNATGNIVLRSPLAGVVLTRTAVPGTVVDAGAPMVVVTDLSRLWLTVNTPEQFAGLLRVGSQVRFLVPAYPDTFTARVTALGAGLESETRTLSVRAETRSRGNRLKPGMLATVAIVGAQRMTAAMVPEDAVQAIDGKPNVFLAQPDGKGGVRITRREVEVGSRSGGQVAVVRGLSAGEIVVTAGAFAVKAEFQKAAMPKMVM